MGISRVHMAPEAVYELRCEFASMADVAFIPGLPVIAGHDKYYVGGYDGVEIMCTEPFFPVRSSGVGVAE